MKLKQWLAAAVSGVMLFGVGTVLPETVREIAPVEITAEAAASDFTQEQAVQWMRDRANEAWCVDVDGVAGCQCVDLAKAYYLYLGYGMPVANGYEYGIIGLPDGWTRVYSDPHPGDLFWKDRGFAGADATYGHVGLVMEVNGSTVTTMETNSEKGQAAHTYSRSTSSISGYVRPNFKASIPQGHVMSESEAAGQTIPDGDYVIVSGLDENYFLDIKGYTTDIEEDTAVQMWREYPKDTDVFTFTYSGNGFYTISQKGTNMCLDVAEGSLNRGTAVQMHHDNDTNAQQWSVIKTNSGYKLQSRCNSFYLDVKDGAVAERNPVHTWTSNDTNSQVWGLIPYQPEQIVKDGLYKIAFQDTNWFLDINGDGDYADGANAQIQENDGDIFYVQYVDDGYYSISEYETNLMLNAESGDFLDMPRNVAVKSSNDSRQQLWAFQSTDDGQYFIANKLNGSYLDLASGICENGHNIQLWGWAYPTTLNQKWSLIPYEEPKPDILHGDLYKDNNLTVIDILLLQRYLLCMDTFTADQFTTADMNGDGEVDVFDLALLKRAVLAQ